MALMKSLFELRRVNKTDDDEVEEGLMQATLRDPADKAASLQEKHASIAGIQAPIEDLGGTRHATNCIYGRVLQVIERKIHLVERVENRTQALVKAQADRVEISRKLVQGSLQEPPKDLMGIKRFIANLTHPGGNPADANKSDFEAFASSFKLPGDHFLLERLRVMSKEVSEWWLKETLRVAETGVNLDVLDRVAAVALGCGGVTADHPVLLQALMFCARNMKNDFKDFQDPNGVWPRSPPIGKANLTADRIERAINPIMKHATATPGVKKMLEEASTICKELRQMEGVWKRMLGRQKRLSQQASVR